MDGNDRRWPGVVDKVGGIALAIGLGWCAVAASLGSGSGNPGDHVGWLVAGIGVIAVGVLLLVVGIVGGLFRPGDQPEAARTSAPAPSTPPDDPPVTMDKFFELREMTKPAALAEASSSRSVGTAEPAPLKLDFDWVVPPEQVASEPVFKMALVVTNHDRTAKLSARVCSNVTGIIDLSYKHFNLGWEGHAGERREIQNGQSEYLTVALYDLPRRKIRFVLPETTYSGPGKHSLGKEQDLVADTVTFDVDFFDANHQRRCYAHFILGVPVGGLPYLLAWEFDPADHGAQAPKRNVAVWTVKQLEPLVSAGPSLQGSAPREDEGPTDEFQGEVREWRDAADRLLAPWPDLVDRLHAPLHTLFPEWHARAIEAQTNRLGGAVSTLKQKYHL